MLSHPATRLAHRNHALRSFRSFQMRAPMVLCAAAILGSAACEKSIELPPLREAKGTITVLDTGGPEGDTGWWPSITFDDDDRAHIAYCDAWRGDLRYASRINGNWKNEAVIEDGAVGKYAAVAVAPKGAIAGGVIGIAFYDQDTKYLKYAWRQTATSSVASDAHSKASPWTVERIAWGLEVGMGSELRFTKDGTAHLFYYVPSGKLAHAQRPAKYDAGATETWTKSVLTEVTGSWTVRIDPVLRKDGLWVSYVDWNFKDTTLYIGRPAGPFAIAPQQVSEKFGPGWRSQLIFDNDEPRVIYSEMLKANLRISQHVDGQWQSTILVKRVGNFASSQDAKGDVTIAYEDIEGGTTGRGMVRLLTRRRGVWERWTIDPEGPTGAYLDIATDSQGNAAVAYYARDIRGLKVYETALP